MIGRNLGTDISDHLIGCPDIPTNHIHHRLVERPSLVELHERDEKSFFKNIMVV